MKDLARDITDKKPIDAKNIVKVGGELLGARRQLWWPQLRKQDGRFSESTACLQQKQF